jgi:hypothetical protein
MDEPTAATPPQEPAEPPPAHPPACSRSPVLPVLLAWLVPGAGHFAIGRPWPGIFVAAATLPLFVGGMALAGWLNVSPERHPWYFAAHAFIGLPTGIATLLTRTSVPTEPLAYRSAGELYTAMAGLLNLVAIADVWARCRHGDPFAAPAPQEPAAGLTGDAGSAGDA